MPQLVGPDGRPIASKNRLRSVDADVLIGMRRKRFQSVIASGLTPERLAGIFELARLGRLDDFLTLAREIEKHDSHYRSVMGIRKLTCLARRPIVHPASDDSRDVFVAEELQALVDSPEWTWASLWSLDALGKGYSSVELVWDMSEGQAEPRFKRRDARDFTLDRDRLERVQRKIPGTNAETEDLPWGKYVIHTPGLIDGSPIDSALAWTGSILYLYSALVMHDLADFIERFGTPTLLGEYLNESQRQEILDGLAALSRAGYGAFPPGSTITTLDGSRMGGGEKLHDLALRMLDEQKSKLVLGQTMTSDNGSSRSQAEVHDQVKDDVTNWDCWAMSMTQVQQIAAPWTALNYGSDTAVPTMSRPGDDEQDIAAIAQVLFGMVDRGAKISVSHLLDMIGAVEADGDESVLEPISTGNGDIPGMPGRGQTSTQPADDVAPAAE